jgi:hypothetical protein
VSENFPFETADEFLEALKEIEKMAKPERDEEFVDVQPDASIHVPEMPDKTQIQKSSRLGAVALLGIGIYTQDRWVLLAAVLGTAAIEVMRLYSDMKIRGDRNRRLGDENAVAMQSAAQIRSSFIERNE